MSPSTPPKTTDTQSVETIEVPEGTFPFPIIGVLTTDMSEETMNLVLEFSQTVATPLPDGPPNSVPGHKAQRTKDLKSILNRMVETHPSINTHPFDSIISPSKGKGRGVDTTEAQTALKGLLKGLSK